MTVKSTAVAVGFAAALLASPAIAGLGWPAGTGARIVFEKELHDYGTVKFGANGTSTFVFENTGDAPLVIVSAKGSCGCVVPSWPKAPVMPGASGTIQVKYDTKRPGPINKSVTITSNAVNAPTIVIRVKGTVEAAPGGG
ncbi:DUF1573 domain-containing protein [Sphingomonas sp.]|uniref:DUF1573 domain-containing protein n=1 Tax=Sphingomonas sp. TaxID=28214 RepID=UPI001EBDD303|nr:DUF1573 domain-containing protein [Sphingomonas sp.]MBX3595078.1 DUF1573 domain-containing protein [Sphingomonas sp.]